MLQKIIISIFITSFLVAGLISCSNQARFEQVEKGQKIVLDNVKLGDDIFEAKKVLESKGLSIMADGPNFATKDKSYYSMVIDYGVGPSFWDTFRYTVGIESSEDEKPIYGLVEAHRNGKIYEIE